MAKTKELQSYLTGRCLIAEGLTKNELAEFLTEFQKDEPSLALADFDTLFVRHEVNETDKTVTYYYSCKVCGIEHENVLPLETDFVYLGNCPSEDEDTSFKLYATTYMCRALIDQLRKEFGQEPEGAKLRSKLEIGADCREVVCEYDTRYPMSMAYAFMLESNPPEHWTAASRKTLEEITGIPYSKGKSRKERR